MSACVARMASRSSCNMKRRLKKVKPLWALTVSIRSVRCASGSCIQGGHCQITPSCKHRAGRSTEQQRIVGELLAANLFEHVQQILDPHATALVARDVEHHLALMQHDRALAHVEC